ncbi:MAG: fibronectin type III domain-containing protein [Candidatus Scalinduaceae bacterium]
MEIVSAPDTTPPVISAITLQSLTDNSVTITWTTDEPADSQVDYGLDTSYGNTVLDSLMVISHTLQVTGLLPNTEYHYIIISRDGSGNMAVSNDLTFTTLSLADITAPTIPQNLSAQPLSQSEINLSWDASTDPSTGSGQVSGVAGYRVYRDGVEIVTTMTTSYPDSGLTPGTSYAYAVSAFDAAGNESGRSPSVLAITQSSIQNQVGLYDVFETQVTNTKNYSNPFDYTVIELQATFTAPSGKTVDFFGFYDGDGNGGQTGNVWKLRFMPDETSTWSYNYTWTDGTPGGSGSFEVVDTGLPGHLKIATDNPWYFETARGEPFHFRGCGFMFWHKDIDQISGFKNFSFTAKLEEYKAAIQSDIDSVGCNFIYTNANSDREQVSHPESWWIDGSESGKKIFDLTVWTAMDDLLTFLKDQRVYAMPWSAFFRQGQFYAFSDEKVFLRYWVARMAPYYNWNGWSLTWEWPEVLSESQVTQVMSQVKDWNPFSTLLTSHDSSRSSFTNWMSFSARQRQSRTVFTGNSRSAGQHGGIQGPFINMPIIGAEDIWEDLDGGFGNPRNETEVRRGAWGGMLAGVMPIYTEFGTRNKSSFGQGEGKDDVKRMFDFFYSKTQYRQYQKLNSLVSSSARQIASGIPGQEYLVYDEDGGSITIDLSGTASSDAFSVLWYDPKDNGIEQAGGSVNGGASRTLTSPFSSDSVLLLGGVPPDATPPTIPQNLSATAKSESQIDFTWQAADDPESGISKYNIYRDGANVGQPTTTSFSDAGLDEGTTYTYEVSAVNGAGLESARSTPISATTLADTIPPTITSVSVSDNAVWVTVVFSEPVEQVSAEEISNYDIDNGITISVASLGTDLKTVTLTTSPHSEGTTYTLTVNNIQDRASTPNVITANTQATYTFVAQLIISNLTVVNGKIYEVVEDGLQNGALAYIDRSFTYSTVPASVQGTTYIKTANNDKSSTGTSFFTFDVNQDVTVLVAHDNRITPKPSWMSPFTDTGEDIVTTDTALSLFAKDFPAGAVVLGGNEGSGNSMYTVVILGQGSGSTPPDTTPPADPVGLRIVQ